MPAPSEPRSIHDAQESDLDQMNPGRPGPGQIQAGTRAGLPLERARGFDVVAVRIETNAYRGTRVVHFRECRAAIVLPAAAIAAA